MVQPRNYLLLGKGACHTLCVCLHSRLTSHAASLPRVERNRSALPSRPQDRMVDRTAETCLSHVTPAGPPSTHIQIAEARRRLHQSHRNLYSVT